MARGEGGGLGVGTLASKVGETAGEIERAVAASLAGAAPTLGGCAPLGSLRASFPGTDAARVKAIVERLRAAVAAAGGRVTVQRAPPDVPPPGDPWGPGQPGPLPRLRPLQAGLAPAPPL